jgi:hypothetical protein
MMADKNQIIKEIYENPILGYGSITDTFHQAIKKIKVLLMMMLNNI